MQVEGSGLYLALGIYTSAQSMFILSSEYVSCFCFLFLVFLASSCLYPTLVVCQRLARCQKLHIKMLFYRLVVDCCLQV